MKLGKTLKKEDVPKGSAYWVMWNDGSKSYYSRRKQAMSAMMQEVSRVRKGPTKKKHYY